MKNNFKILTISTFYVLLLSGCRVKEPENPIQPKSVEAIPVKVIFLNRAEVTESVHSSGQFTTDDETVLSFKTGGLVDRIYVKEGDKIKKGQLLATLDLTEISSVVNQTQIAFDQQQHLRFFHYSL